MADLIERYAADLLEYGREQGELEDFYTYAFILVNKIGTGITQIPNKLDYFLRLVPNKDVKAVLIKFIDICREHWKILDVKVFSATPLTEAQQAAIEDKLIGSFNKQVHMVVKVDPSLLGGLRIIAGYTVMDNTIKKRLAEMKKSMYKGVYFK
jgi:F0F1-type ATP synthase delta subunit